MMPKQPNGKGVEEKENKEGIKSLHFSDFIIRVTKLAPY